MDPAQIAEQIGQLKSERSALEWACQEDKGLKSLRHSLAELEKKHKSLLAAEDTAGAAEAQVEADAIREFIQRLELLRATAERRQTAIDVEIDALTSRLATGPQAQ